jgi:CPA1 family monovalent cation:H+ antiporter
MHGIELFLLLLLLICAVNLFAVRKGIASSIIFVLGGLCLGFIPEVPKNIINPESILPIFLPPLLMEAAYFTSHRDLKANVRPIMKLAVLVVLATAAAIALVFQALVPAATLAAGFVLGAIISPPDAVAAASIIKRAHVPKRVITILEGESLVNDATGLIIYKFAVAAVVAGSFSATSASVEFLWMAIGGSLIGGVIGYLFMRLFPYIKETYVEILSTFLVCYTAYIAGELAGASGVLSVVACGLVVGWKAPVVFSHNFRNSAEPVWKMVSFLLSGAAFLLIGIEFPSVLRGLSAYTITELVLLSFVVCAVMVVVRFISVFMLAYLSRLLIPSLRRRDPYPPWQNIFIISWAGMRGVVTLATALALPMYTDTGERFPHRDLIIFLGFVAIFFSLIAQGLSLKWLIRKLNMTVDFNDVSEEWNARKRSLEEALRALDGMCNIGQNNRYVIEKIREHYLEKLRFLGDGPNTRINDDEEVDDSKNYIAELETKIWTEVQEVERRIILAMRHAYEISDEVMYNLLNEIEGFSPGGTPGYITK